MIIFVGGLIGAGKSTVARALADKFGLFYYDIDEIKKSVFREDPAYEHNMKHGIPFCDASRTKVYDIVINDIQRLAKTHRCIVVDETLHKRPLRHQLFEAAEKFFGGYFVVWVKADEEVIEQRLSSKVREGHILKDPMSMHNTMVAEFDGFEQCVIVCRNNTTIDETMKEANRFFSTIFRFGEDAGKERLANIA